MVSLKLSLTENKALNQDGITALRSLSLVQGQTYDISVSLFSGFIQVAPVVSNFSFVLSDSRGASLVSLNSISSNGSGYLFSLPLVSPAIGFSPTYSGSVSFDANGTLEIIEPFNVSIAPSAYNGNTAGFVSSLNNLTSNVIIAGGGFVSLSTSGQTITLSGTAPTGSYYPLSSNPSGYLTSSALTPYALQTALNATGTGLQGQLNALNGQSGSWYPRTNPSGYISSIPSDVVRTSGNQTISGVKTFADEIQVFSISTPFRPAIDVSDLRLLGNWYLDGQEPIAAGWMASATLTTTVDTDATPASVFINGTDWTNASDGTTFNVTIDGLSWDFTFRDNVTTDHELPSYNGMGGDAGATAGACRDAISSIFNNYPSYYQLASVGWDGSTLSITTLNTGGSESIFVSGFINASASGTDASSSGTRIASPEAPNSLGRTFIITEVVAYCTAGSAWVVADIEIGYGTSDDDFQRALLLPQASITPGMHSLKIDINPATEGDAIIFMDGILGAGVVVREASGGSPVDETTGADVHIYLRGIYY